MCGTTIQPFTIHLEQEILDDLRARLARTRWPAGLDDVGWYDGANPAYMRHLAAWWRNGFDWRAQEAALNTFAHVRVAVDGVELHAIHERGTGPRTLPLLLTHGWPSSFVEMRKIVPLLTNPGRHGGDPTDAFNVVVPSLPGYCFSDPLPGRGATRRTPDLWVGLMAALGYPRFAAFGSDIGAWVTNRLGHEHPDRVIGIAVTQLAEPYLGAGTPALSDRERAYLAKRARSAEANSGYAHIQRTKPQTLAFGLADSPVGLAAWIVDRYQSWSDCSGDVERRFSKDDLLTVVTLYWATQTIASSFRIYREWALASALTPGAHEVYPDAPTGADATPFGPGERIAVPAAIVLPRGDNAPPREWAERAYDLRRWTELPRGGHFLAFEEPTLLVEELRAFFRPLR